MAGLLAADRAFIEKLRKAGVFLDVENHLIDQTAGVILVTCSDADRFCDIFMHQIYMQSGCRPDPRIHVLAWHGGALACAPCSPINRRKHADDVFLDQIIDARALKGINVVALYAHAPCGAAGHHGVSLERVIALQVRAKRRIKALNEGVMVVCFFHVDYGNGKQRTYFLCREKWEQWAEAHGIQAIA